MVTRIVFILHADFEKPGAIATWADERGFAVQYCRPFSGESLPEVESFDWLVVMGGPQSPLDHIPYLDKEIVFIKEALSKGKTVLGFCLGAQLIGEAFGAKTERSPHKEIGVFPIQLSEEKDPVLKGLPKSFEVVHWHNDMPGLIGESTVLASSEGCPRQIVRYSNRAYGFQCHPEPSHEDIEGMILHCKGDLDGGRYVQTEEMLLSFDFEAINVHMYRILDNLLSYQKRTLGELKNVGKATLGDLELLEVRSVEELARQDATDLFYKMEERTGKRQDPCVWDVFAAIIHEAKTGERTAWWEWTAERKAMQKSGVLVHRIGENLIEERE